MNLGWPHIPLGEVLRERRETPKESDLAEGRISIVQKISFDTGEIRFRVGGETKTGMILVRSGDLLVSGINAAKGAIAIHDKPGIGPIAATIHYGAYQPDNDRVDVKFLWWMLRSNLFRELLARYVPGGIKTELKAKRLLPVPVPLPPIDKQCRVVQWIEELVGKVAEARILRRQAADSADAIFFATCEAKLRAVESTYPAKQLHEIVDAVRGISYGIVQTGTPAPEGVPTLRAGDLQWFHCNTENVKRVSQDKEANYRRTRLRGGELLLRIRGGVGAVALCPVAMIGGNVSREIAVIPLADEILPDYAMYLMAAPTTQNRMAGDIKGTSYVGLNLKDVRRLKIPVAPLPEQRRIVTELNEARSMVDALKDMQVETATKFDTLLSSVLDHVFHGKL